MHLRRCGQPVAVGVLTALGLVLAGALAGCGDHRLKGAGGEINQAAFEALIRQDRAELMNGQLSYIAPENVAVSETRALAVTLQSAPIAEYVPSGQAQPSINLKVGGVEGATLTATAGSVTISRVGPATGLIAQPGDKVSWTWDITPLQPGRIVLDLVVVTYLGQTTEPLYTLSPPLAIDVSVANTIGHQAGAVGSDIATIGAVVGSVAGAIIAVAGCVAGIMHWRTRRKKRGKQTPPAAPEVPAAAAETDRPWNAPE